MKDNVPNWEKLQVYDTIYSADSVEFCPIEPYQHIFLCGTYQLTENEDSKETVQNTKRKGSIILFEFNENDKLMKHIETVETHAILDIKWCHHKVNQLIIFAIVNAIGQLIVYKMIDIENNIKIEQLCQYQLISPNSNEILALSLDWSSRKMTNDSIDCDSIVVSDSHGGVSIFFFNNEGLSLTYEMKSHGFECWIAAFNYCDTNVIYTGGDDCKLKIHDTKQNRIIQTNNEHGAGVTSIQYNPYKEYELATGSYDENLYLWDTRNMKSYLKKINLNGGIWRIKHQSESSILTATMYNGFHYVNTISDDFVWYNEHGSIAYGIDSYYKSKQYVVACSFYNHLLSLSELSTSSIKSV